MTERWPEIAKECDDSEINERTQTKRLQWPTKHVVFGRLVYDRRDCRGRGRREGEKGEEGSSALHIQDYNRHGVSLHSVRQGLRPDPPKRPPRAQEDQDVTQSAQGWARSRVWCVHSPRPVSASAQAGREISVLDPKPTDLVFHDADYARCCESPRHG